jgi:hypothetical protein
MPGTTRSPLLLNLIVNANARPGHFARRQALVQDSDSLFALSDGLIDRAHRPIAMAVSVVEGFFQMLPRVPEIVNGIAIFRVLGGSGFGQCRVQHRNC